MMNFWKSALAGAAIALLSSTASFAAKTDLVLGIVLEPPHLDPTAGAAAAIDEIVYANIFEGLTRIGSKGERSPRPRRKLDDVRTTARSTHSSCTRT